MWLHSSSICVAPNPLDDEEDDEDLESLITRIPEDASELQKCMLSAQGCILLLVLKQHLKATYRITERYYHIIIFILFLNWRCNCIIYGFTNSKISRYSPSEAAKVYEKSMQRHPVEEFDPKSTLDIIRKNRDGAIVEKLQLINEVERKQLIEQYLDVSSILIYILGTSFSTLNGFK